MIYFSDFSTATASGGSATLTVPSGTVASTLTNYPLYIDLSEMPPSFWSTSNDGKDLRANIGGTQIACDVVFVDTVNQTGSAFVLVPSLASGSNTVISLTWDGTSDLPAVGSTYGRNAVWADYASVYLFGQTAGDNRKGGTDAEMWDDADYFEVIDSSGATDLNSHQGVDWDGTYYYTTDTNAIYKWSSTWTLVDSNTNPIADAAIAGTPTVNHCGDVLCHDGKLYIPIEAYPAVGGLYNAHIAVFDATDLSFITAYNISAQAHEAASVAYCDRDGYLYVCDYDANFNKLFKYTTTGSYVGQLTLSKNIYNMQGVTWWRDYFWVSHDDVDETVRVAYDGTCSLGSNPADGGGLFGQLVTSGNYEGIGHREDALIQLTDTTTISTVKAYRPYNIPLGGGGGFHNYAVTGQYTKGTGQPTLSSFTIGATFAIDNKSQNRMLVSYAQNNTTSANQRVTFGYRQTSGTFGLWDPSNSWLLPSPVIDPSLGTFHRAHIVHNGTTARHIYYDGALKATDNTIVTVASLDTLYIGDSDNDYLETWQGKIGFVYLRSGVLSANWIAAEYANLNNPGGFYTIS